MPERFIVLAYPRTGSSLIALGLKTHPQVAMYSELFHPVEEFRKNEAMSPQRTDFPLADYYREGADPGEFLERHVYRREFPPERKAVGFKLFQQHLRGAPQARLWAWLAGARDIRIIHLYRQRLLEQYLSLEVAKVTHQWGLEVGSGERPAEAPRIVIDAEGFRKYADENVAMREQVPVTFREHPLLTIEYHADVQERYEATVQRIEEFLGLDRKPLPQLQEKQARRPVREEIINFQELRDALEGTKYEALL